MVEPLFRLATDLEPENLSLGGLAKLDPADAKHAISVRRMRVGEAIALTDGHGLRLRGTVASIDGQVMSVLVSNVVHEEQPLLHITLVQALAKGDRDELAIQAATELGAMMFIPWQAERSVSKWDGPKVTKGVDRWQAIVNEAAKQSLRVFEPSVGHPLNSKQLAKQIEAGELGMALVLEPTATQGLVEFFGRLRSSAAVSELFGVQSRISLIVGPEGGISEGELVSFDAAGAHRVRLGGEILRTSTAGMAAISAIQALAGSWK